MSTSYFSIGKNDDKVEKIDPDSSVYNLRQRSHIKKPKFYQANEKTERNVLTLAINNLSSNQIKQKLKAKIDNIREINKSILLTKVNYPYCTGTYENKSEKNCNTKITNKNDAKHHISKSICVLCMKHFANLAAHVKICIGLTSCFECHLPLQRTTLNSFIKHLNANPCANKKVNYKPNPKSNKKTVPFKGTKRCRSLLSDLSSEETELRPKHMKLDSSVSEEEWSTSNDDTKSFADRTRDYLTHHDLPFVVNEDEQTPADGNCFYFALLANLKTCPEIWTNALMKMVYISED